MLTILEGPDCAGKTTLAKTVFADHDYVHLGPPPQGKDAAFRQYLEVLEDICTRPNGVVVDRFTYGELIYGPVFRQDHSFQPWMVRMIERVLLGHRTVLVWCLPEWETVKREWTKRKGEEMIQQQHQLQLVYDRYQDMANCADKPLANGAMVPTIIYNYEQWQGNKSSENLRAFIEAKRPGVNAGPGIGRWDVPPYMATLFVGEQVNKNTHRQGWPFVAPDGSSAWLAEQLAQSGVDQSQFYWVNSKQPDGSELDPQFIRTLNPYRVIALGQTADNWCTKHRLKHHNLPHPSYWKRFRHGKRYPLIQVLLTPPGPTHDMYWSRDNVHQRRPR